MDQKTTQAQESKTSCNGRKDRVPLALARQPRLLLPATLICLTVLFFIDSHTLFKFSGISNKTSVFPRRGIKEQLKVIRDRFPTTTYVWTDQASYIDLVYTPCYNGFQCARLDVPLNWNASNDQANDRAAIAIVKLPAKVLPTDPRYGGIVVFNPGGPGESGIHQVLEGGPDYQIILDSSLSVNEYDESAKYFDILGFDPRGVNNTTPRLHCFPDPFNQQAWALQHSDFSLLWESEVVIGLEWARASSFGASCSRDDNGTNVARFVNTAQTAYDMVAIVEAHGRWREQEVQSLLSDEPYQVSLSDHAAITERSRWQKGQEQLQYIGYSYGTVLGATFAAMFPDKVSRILLDGVVDPADHYAGAWLTQLQDTDKIISKYCHDCYSAGPTGCPLFTGTSGADVEARLVRIMDSLMTNPIPVPAQGSRGPEIVTYGDIYLIMLGAMYFPFAWHGAEGFFELVSQIETGNVTEIANTKQSTLKPAVISEDCRAQGPYSDACATTPGEYVSGLGPVQTIACMDADGSSNMTRADYSDYLKELGDQSRWISKSWARNKLACVGYDVRPAWTFEGPIRGNASSMLIIGNTHDTVTPLRNAHKVSNLFTNSVVLQQDSEGHCSFSNPSICTAKIIRQYFQTNILPEEGTVCEPERKPFVGCLKKNSTGSCEILESPDLELWEALDRRAHL